MTSTVEATPLALLTAQIDEVWRGYVQAMLWANAVCDVEDCEDRAAGGDCKHVNDAMSTFEVEDVRNPEQARREVEDMVLGNLRDFREYLDARESRPEDGSVASHFGHDFALTRNGHGAGFWDRGLAELGDRLSAASKPYGKAHIFIDEDAATFE